MSITAQLDIHIVRKPHSFELAMGLNAPISQLPNIQLHIQGEGKQQAGSPFILENADLFEFCSSLQDSCFCQQLIDTILPFLQRTAAALKDKALLILIWRSCSIVISFILTVTFPPSDAVAALGAALP